MRRRIAILLFVLGLGLLGLGQAASQEPDSDLLGGQTTIFNQTANAFSQPAPGLERQQQLFFFVGNSFFNQNWVAAPASTQARDGLGPFFNSRSCAGCHFKDGRGRPPETPGEAPTGFLIRLSIPERDLHGAYLPDPNYGGQFQDQAIIGPQGEGDFLISYEEIAGQYADGSPYSLRRPLYELSNLQYEDLHPEVMFSPRVANQMIGLGLLEAIPEDRLLALADPNDRDGDGISGRPNYVWDYYNGQQALGRFGWKANQPHLLQQVSAAFAGDMGISTSLFPGPHCSPAQEFCADLPNGGQPEISDDDLLKVVLYSSVLAVPAQRNADDPQVRWGQELFTTAKCSSCHVPRQETGLHPTIPSLSYQVIYPYTDLLLHDMGPDLADGRPDFEASGQEWRTPPLWGIGLFQTVNGHSYYLHDGRARNLEEAILWHGGEALGAQQAFLQMTAEERAALLAFLKSL